MANKEYEVSGGSEWEAGPDAYWCDATVYADRVTQYREALKQCGGSYIACLYTFESDESGFMRDCEPEDATHTFTDYNGQPVPCRLVDGNDYDARWQGPHLRVWDDIVTLYWAEKHGDKELWVDLRNTDIFAKVDTE